jgi:hypothetical protein
MSWWRKRKCCRSASPTSTSSTPPSRVLDVVAVGFAGGTGDVASAVGARRRYVVKDFHTQWSACAETSESDVGDASPEVSTGEPLDIGRTLMEVLHVEE